MDRSRLWKRYDRYLCRREELGLTLDVSRMVFGETFLGEMGEPLARAFGAMEKLEGGAVANPDEGRQVGHYWLRAPHLAPDPELREAIRQAQRTVRRFAAAVHRGEISAAPGAPFTDLLLIGIGGSALGPQLLADALGRPGRDRLAVHFFDNTDPDGMDRCLAGLGERLATTLFLVVSKSGGTKETRNGMLVARAAVEARGLDFASRAAAVTGEGSALDQLASREGWLARFPMWDWVGGRTSVTSAVGLLPAALQGLDTEALLAGAAACDAATRERDLARNPAAWLALMWHSATGGVGAKQMVVLPYSDRLLLFSRYLQQLVMESLGKEHDLEGNRVEQGITVYGNKGATDQHAYVQQLRDGLDNFFVTFIEILEDSSGEKAEGFSAAKLQVEPGVTSGDYLRGFLLGTREALAERGRESMTLTLRRLDAFGLGVLIALYERAVGLYASLVGVNAYHQPGVEAGKKAAARVLELQASALGFLQSSPGAHTAGEIAEGIGEPEQAETIYQVFRGLAANGRGIRRSGEGSPREIRWQSDPETTQN